jgi:excinuclease ABC subunit A
VTQRTIELRGVAVNNLRQVDLDLPHRKLIVFCGVSGSGKTSMALDTLYAEGQRRYIESFSAYTRQFLEQLDKPEAERIEGIPPAIAVTHKNPSRSNRATVGTITEVNDYLSLLFARVGVLMCYRCGQPVRRESPQLAAEALTALPAATRLMIGFESAAPSDGPIERWLAQLIERGFVRAIVGDRTGHIEPKLAMRLSGGQPITVVLDRLAASDASASRVQESLEGAFAAGDGAAVVLVEESSPVSASHRLQSIDGRNWRRVAFRTALRCD